MKSDHSDQTQETIFIAPGYNSCNVYAMPYPMREGQSPRDLADRYKESWVCIGQLDHKLEIRFLDAKYQDLKDDIQGQGPLTFFSVPKERNISTNADLTSADATDHTDDAESDDSPRMRG